MLVSYSQQDGTNSTFFLSQKCRNSLSENDEEMQSLAGPAAAVQTLTVIVSNMNRHLFVFFNSIKPLGFSLSPAVKKYHCSL